MAQQLRILANFPVEVWFRALILGNSQLCLQFWVILYPLLASLGTCTLYYILMKMYTHTYTE